LKTFRRVDATTVVLVTGAAGFIGSHVSEALLGRGARVVGIDSFDDYYDRRRKEANLKVAQSSERFVLLEGDICDEAFMAEAANREGPFDAIIHLAARAGVRPSIANPLSYERTNIAGTMVLLELAASQTPRPRVVFASSSSVYGNNVKVPFSESDPVDHPISPYAATKKACELLCHTYHHLYDIPIYCMRLFTVYGPRQRPDLAIHRFAKRILSDESIEMYGDGSSSRDYTYIADIVAGLLAAVDRCDGFEVLNLGGTNPVTLREMIRCVERACGRRAQVIERPMQPGDVNRTYADISRAAALLDYQPQTDFQEGVNAFVTWYRQAMTD
jgi:UDP-glucuronate 4-epimerase